MFNSQENRNNLHNAVGVDWIDEEVSVIYTV